MDAKDLYEWLKDSTNFFGLRFFDMSEVQVSFLPATGGVEVRLSHGGNSISQTFDFNIKDTTT